MTPGNLIYLAVALLVVAILAAAFGFGEIAETAIPAARILFWIAIAALVIVAVMGMARRRRR